MSKSLEEREEFVRAIDHLLIDAGYDAECVMWVCEEHRRHCTLIEIDHDEHACIFDSVIDDLDEEDYDE